MESTDAAWTDNEGRNWIVTFTEEDDVLVSVTVASGTAKPLPLTTLTRGIPYSRLLDKIRQERYSREVPDGTTWRGSTGRTWTVHGAGMTVSDGSTTTRRRTMTREHFEEVARVYNAAHGLKNPTERVQEHFMVSKSTAARWVSQARRDPWGTLPPTTRGKPT